MNSDSNTLSEKKVIDTTQLQVIQINFDSLKVLTPGENGKPPLKVVKAGAPIVTNSRIAPIKAGKPNVVTVDESKLNYITPGNNGVPLPRTYHIPDTGYSIQYGDTISASSTRKVIQPKPTVALPPRYKDNAIFNIQYLDVEQGLPSSYINSIVQDRRGNIWFCCGGGGVACYDGKSFVTYSKNEGLSNNVSRAFEDSHGNIWFGTEIGAFCYNGETLVHFSKQQGLCGNNILSISEDKNGNIWFGIWNGGISKLSGKTITNYTPTEGLGSNRVFTVIFDSQNNAWIASSGGGITKFDGKTFVSYNQENGCLGSNYVTSLREDAQGNIWAGIWFAGISKFDGKTFTSYSTDEGLSNNNVRNIVISKNGNLWIATDNGGLNFFDGTHFNHYSIADGIATDGIGCILEDSSKNIWFGTSGNGVYKLSTNSFVSFTQTEGLINPKVNTIFEDKQHRLWFGTSGGVSMYDGQSFTSYTTAQGLLNNEIKAITQDSKGNMWFASLGGGVGKFDGKKFYFLAGASGLDNDFVHVVFEDSKGYMWMGNYLGVFRWDGHSAVMFAQKDGMVEGFVNAISEDTLGNLWFSTNFGVSRYNGKTFTNFTNKDLTHIATFPILMNNNSSLWMLSKNGISKYHKNVLTTYYQTKILTNHTINSIINDHDDVSWLTTNKGLYYINFSNNANIIASFTNQDGLKANDFLIKSAYKDHRNQLWLGSGKALIMLDVNKFQLSQTPPSVSLRNIDIKETFVDFRSLSDSLSLNKDYFIGKDNDISLADVEFSTLPAFYNYPLDMSLPYTLDHLCFYFTAIDWAAPHKIEYQYILEGLDKQWSPLTKETKAEYRNLPHGSFTFKVKAIGVAQKWSDTFSYQFTIRPPIWLTWWFKTILVIVGLLFIFGFIKLRERKLEYDKQMLQEKVDEQTHTLKIQNNELFQQKEEIKTQAELLQLQNQRLLELDQFKEGMTGMIVHDLKNPLNTIIGTAKSKEVQHAGKQMLNMVLNILDVQKLENAEVKIQPIDFLLNTCIAEALLQVKLLYERKSITIINNITNDIAVRADFELINRVFINLFTNAIKYTPNNGSITISKETVGNNDKIANKQLLVIKVTDNGTGIPSDKLELVFDKFAQIEAKNSGNVRSTGLGLTFCKLAIEAHRCQIGVHSTLGQGSTFWFTLPQRNIHETINSNADTVTQKIELTLNTDDKQYLLNYTPLLQKLTVYEFSDVDEVLHTIEPRTQNIEYWKHEIENALKACNEQRYNELINL